LVRVKVTDNTFNRVIQIGLTMLLGILTKIANSNSNTGAEKVLAVVWPLVYHKGTAIKYRQYFWQNIFRSRKHHNVFFQFHKGHRVMPTA